MGREGTAGGPDTLLTWDLCPHVRDLHIHASWVTGNVLWQLTIRRRAARTRGDARSFIGWRGPVLEPLTRRGHENPPVEHMGRQSTNASEESIARGGLRIYGHSARDTSDDWHPRCELPSRRTAPAQRPAPHHPSGKTRMTRELRQ